MKFELMKLPYATDALAPFIGGETVEVHHQKHHGGYVKKLAAMLEGSEMAEQSLEDIMLASSGDQFNLAAQVWNHDFYWQSLTPDPQHVADHAELVRALNHAFGDLESFREAFTAAAAGEFGSGWAWLTYDPQINKLAVHSTSDAANPLLAGCTPVLTLDVWEHAYYLDYKNERGAYIDAFLDGHVNWEFAASNLAAAMQREVA